MKDPKDYTKLVEQAEKAVAAVKDPELKRIAFQKILDSLLLKAEGGAPARSANRAPHRTTSQPGQQRVKNKGGPTRYISELVDEGFFRKPQTITQVKAELENRGHHIPLTSLSGPLQNQCQSRTLRRQKIKTSGKKGTFAYSNW